jgi:hypothetical protein
VSVHPVSPVEQHVFVGPLYLHGLDLSWLLADCETRVYVAQASKDPTSFTIETERRNSHIHSVAFWDNPECRNMWFLSNKAGWKQDSLHLMYGTYTREMCQVFPEGNAAPRKVLPGELIVVDVFIRCDWLPVGISATYPYHILEDGEWFLLRSHDVKYPWVIGGD